MKTYSAWNEVNHASQPTYKKPGLAVRYYEVLRKDARERKFKVMAADILDTSNMAGYLRSFMRKAKGSRACGACTTTRTSTTARRATRG